MTDLEGERRRLECRRQQLLWINPRSVADRVHVQRLVEQIDRRLARIDASAGAQ